MIKARIISEVLGSPEEHVNKALSLILDKIKERKDLNVSNDKIFEAKKLEDKPLFTGFIEYDIAVENPVKLIDLCFDFMPSSIEIFEPDELRFKSSEIGELLNDLLAKLHKTEMALRNAIAELHLSKKEK